MNGTRISSLIKLSGTALLAACFVAGHASAQVFEGKFTLPFQAQWGQATLPPGDYTFKLDNAPLPHTLRLYHGVKPMGTFLAQSYDGAYSGHAELTLEQGKVRSLRLPSMALIIRYAPQHAKHLTAPEERELAQRVQVILARS